MLQQQNTQRNRADGSRRREAAAEFRAPFAGPHGITLAKEQRMSMKIVFTATGVAVLAMLGAPSFAAVHGHRHAKAYAHHHVERIVVRSSAYAAGFDSSARAAVGRSYDFEGWPTDYLTNRFGDHQAQGR